MYGGLEEEIIEMGWNDDQQGEQVDYEAGLRKVTKLHDPKLPSETEMREPYTDADGSLTINAREIKKDWGFLHTTWTTASLSMSSTGSPCWW